MENKPATTQGPLFKDEESEAAYKEIAAGDQALRGKSIRISATFPNRENVTIGGPPVRVGEPVISAKIEKPKI